MVVVLNLVELCRFRPISPLYFVKTSEAGSTDSRQMVVLTKVVSNSTVVGAVDSVMDAAALAKSVVSSVVFLNQDRFGGG